MDPKAFKFLATVLGDSGANALRKAAERAPELEVAILPRAILAWMSAVACGEGFEGEIPGLPNTYLTFEKNATDTYNGQITIGDIVWPFEDASFWQLSASVAVAVGADYQKDSLAKTLTDTDLVKLGRTIDVLVKARFVTENLSKATEEVGTGIAAEPRQTPPIQPQTPTKQRQAPRPKLPQHSFKTPPAPLDHVQKITLPGMKKRELKVQKSLARSRCKACGQTQFKDDAFNGCICFRDLRKSTDTRIEDEHYILSFGKDWENESIILLAQTLGVK